MSYLVNFGEYITETQFDISLAHSVAEGNRSKVLPTVIFRQLDLSEYGIHRFAYSASSRKYFFISNNSNNRGLYWCDTLQNRPEVTPITLPDLVATDVFQDIEVVDDIVIVASATKIWYSEDLGRTWYTHTVVSSILSGGLTIASVAFIVSSSPHIVLYGLSSGSVYTLNTTDWSENRILNSSTGTMSKFSSTNDTSAAHLVTFTGTAIAIIPNQTTPSLAVVNLKNTYDADNSTSSSAETITTSTNLEYLDVCYRDELIYVFVKNLDVSPNAYYYVVYDIAAEKAAYHDFEPYDDTRELMICALDNVEYFEFAPIVLINGNRYRLFTETIWRTLGEECNYINRVDNKYIQLSNSKTPDDTTVFTTFVNEFGHQISSDVTASGLSPDKVFRTTEDKGEGNVQIRGVASGENSLVIDSDVVVSEDNMMAIGHSTNYRYRFGQLEFYVTAEKLIITMIPDQTNTTKNKSFEFLWPTTVGPPGSGGE
jgi:hypothetical protein